LLGRDPTTELVVQLNRRLFFDVTGLLQWYGYFDHPTGVQRVTERLLGSTSLRTYPHIIYVARALGGDKFFEVDRDTILQLGDARSRHAAIARVRSYLTQSVRLSNVREVLSEAQYFDFPYIAAGYARAEALVEAFFLRRMPRRAQELTVARLSNTDVLFNPGDYWCHRAYAHSVSTLKRLTGTRIFMLVHDLFGTEMPEWSHPRFGPHMEQQFRAIAPSVDRWFVTSQYVRQSLDRHLCSLNLLRRKVGVLPMGEARLGEDGEMDETTRNRLLTKLGLAPGYVLHVGTIEPRKNLHTLLDALQKLRRDFRLHVPRCVLVGREGWQSTSIVKRLKATKLEAGTVTWLRSVSDFELRALYEGALFTVVPSLVEGWGLPIGESLAHGVPCIATAIGGTQEAGRGVAVYFDPAKPGALQDALKYWLENPEALAKARSAAEIARLSMPSWNSAGQALLEAVLE